MSSQSPANQNPPNHLIGEKSPYLQQHAHNPVDWYPWGDEAFRRATEEDKPIFLSIGYATCHWCHVMAHESFEDPGIAKLLNTSFIAIKVDREERPDIDSVYMTACQQMTGQGGWPLTIIMTPDKKPFFAGTYIPRTSRQGMAGLSELLPNIVRLWVEQQDTLINTAEHLTDHIAKIAGFTEVGIADRSLLQKGYEELAASFDPVNGGFGGAPKFPVPVTILFLLRYWKRTGSIQALRMAEQTLGAMNNGGIHDHLGGGFHRYSTDARWRIPHFEKMLYDQALLLMAYTEAWLATKKPLYRKTAEAIISYVTRDLSSPEGAFISAEDADSAGGEGAFYLWSEQELDDVLGPGDGACAAAFYGVEPGEQGASADAATRAGVLYIRPGKPASPVDPARIESIRKRLFAKREKRPRPQRDGKILTDWNALMIAALAEASRAFGNPAYYQAAETAVSFILGRLRRPDEGLLHRYCDGEAAIPAFGDDYAFMIRALIELYETSFEPAWLEEALVLNRFVHLHFYDSSYDGFFSTADDSETLIVRHKDIYDGTIPSCNSAMLANLVLLGHLTGDPAYEERASRLADNFAGIVRRSPSAYSAFLFGLDHLLGPAADIVIAGDGSDPAAADMIRMIHDTYLPAVTVHFLRSRQKSAALEVLAPFTRTMTVQEGKTTAYVCTGRTCSAPVTTLETLRESLDIKKETT